MSPQEQYLEWLKDYQPFIYRVLMAKASAGELAFDFDWGKVVGAVASIGGAYMGYRKSKDAMKIEKARLDYEKSLTQPKKSPAIPSGVPAGGFTPKQIKYLKAVALAKQNLSTPPPNKEAMAEALRRMDIAQKGGNQPPAVPGPEYVPLNYLKNSNEAVRVTAGVSTINQFLPYMIPAALIIGGAALIRRN